MYSSGPAGQQQQSLPFLPHLCAQGDDHSGSRVHIAVGSSRESTADYCSNRVSHNMLYLTNDSNTSMRLPNFP